MYLYNFLKTILTIIEKILSDFTEFIQTDSPVESNLKSVFRQCFKRNFFIRFVYY